MDDNAALLLNGKPLTSGTVLPADGDLRLSVPAGRSLQQAVLTLGAVAAQMTAAAVAPKRLDTDIGGLDPAKPVRFAQAQFSGAVALSGVTVTLAAGQAADCKMRVKVFNGSSWAPLMPVDVLALDQPQNFGAVAAERVLLEFLVPNAQGVALPGALKVTGIAFQATGQPCNVSVAVGSDPAFFTQAGPLSATPAAVAGLARAVGRALADDPDSRLVPLSIRAGGAAMPAVAAFSAPLTPLPPVPSGTSQGPQERVWLDVPEPAYELAQLMDSMHALAQGFTALPAGQSLSGVDLLLRPLVPVLSGTLAVHDDDEGRPAAAPLPGGIMEFDLDGDIPPDGVWLTFRPAEPLKPTGKPWWLVCRTSDGECLWYSAPTPPAEASPKAWARLGKAPWQAAPSAPAGWLQTRLRVVPV